MLRDVTTPNLSTEILSAADAGGPPVTSTSTALPNWLMILQVSFGVAPTSAATSSATSVTNKN